MRTTARQVIAGLLVATALLLAPPASHAVDEEEEKAADEEKPDVRNPVRKISSSMKRAGELLEKLETGDPTQEEQKKILKELDRLIEMAQKSGSSGSNSPRDRNRNRSKPRNTTPNNSGGRGSSPMRDERDVYRAVRPNLGSGAPDLRELWGKLPPKQRDEVLQLLREELPLRYKRLIKLYYKAMSEKE
jgi:hypothetical protein